MVTQTSSRVAQTRPLLAGILALAAAMGIGRFAYTPLLPALQEAGGLDTARAGLIAAANYAGYLLGALLVVLVMAGLPRMRVLHASAVGVVATTALMAATTDFAGWSIIRFLSGIASAGVFVLASGLVLDDLRRRGQASRGGWLYSGVGIGIVTSGVVVRASAETLSWRGDWIVLALIAAVALAPCARWLPHVDRQEARASGTAPPMAASVRVALGLLFVAYFLEGLGYIVSGTFLVAIVEQTPGLASLGSGVWIVVGLAAIPSAVFWTASAAHIGYARALACAYALQACGIVLPIVGGVGAAFASAVLFGGTFAGITALTLTFAGQLGRSGSTNLFAMLTASFGLGQVIGPVVAGFIASWAQGFAPALIAAAAVVLVAAGLTVALRTLAGRADGEIMSGEPAPLE